MRGQSNSTAEGCEPTFAQLQENKCLFNNLPFQNQSDIPNNIRTKPKHQELHLQTETLDLQTKPLLQVPATVGQKSTIIPIDNGAQRTLMHPNLFKSVQKKCKVTPVTQDTVLQTVNGDIIKEQGRFLIEKALAFDNEQPKDINVVVTQEFPFSMLLGLPELRKWNAVIIHSDDPMKEGLLLDSDINNADENEQKVSVKAVNPTTCNSRLIALNLERTIKVMPHSGVSKEIQPQIDLPQKLPISYHFNEHTDIRIQPTTIDEETQHPNMTIEIRKHSKDAVILEVINNSDNIITIEKNDIIGVATIGLEPHYTDVPKQQQKKIRIGTEIIHDDKEYVIYEINGEQCSYIAKKDLQMDDTRTNSKTIYLKKKPNAKTFCTSIYNIGQVSVDNTKDVPQLSFEYIAAAHSLPEVAEEKETPQNTDQIRKKLLEAVTIGKFGTDTTVRKRADDILWKYRHLFSRDRMDLSRVKKSVFTHDVTPLPNMPRHKRLPPFRFNKEEKQFVEKYINMLEKSQVLKRNIPSPYSLPCFLVDKADTLPTFIHDEKTTEKVTKPTPDTTKPTTEKEPIIEEEQLSPDKTETQQHLDQCLNHKMINIAPDGNCLFNAVRTSFQHQFPGLLMSNSLTLRKQTVKLGKNHCK